MLSSEIIFNGFNQYCRSGKAICLLSEAKSHLLSDKIAIYEHGSCNKRITLKNG